MKQSVETIHERNDIIENIIQAFQRREQFLILGHKNQDEDCIASMVAMALLVSKFSKKVSVFLSKGVHEHFQYLLDICRHNAIQCSENISPEVNGVDTIVICDTPKPSMIDSTPFIDALLADSNVLKIEIDHHLGADSQYIGDVGYRMVTEANSSSELVGIIALKLDKRTELLRGYNISSTLSRNIILSVITGIVGDTNMGQFVKSRRQKAYYNVFSGLYNVLLERETTKASNFTNMDQVFHEIQRLSAGEEKCYQYMYDKKRTSRSIGYIVLDRGDMDYLRGDFETDTIISVSRSIADRLAEESARLGLVVYDDFPATGLYQFRLRRSQAYKTFDVRKILESFSIKDGGGHEGAIGFRIPREQIPDIKAYVKELVDGIEKILGA